MPDLHLDSALVATPSDQIAAFVQPVAGDLILGKAAGSSTAASPLYLSGVMGNAREKTANDGLTATQNMIAGVVGKMDVQGAISGSYPAAGVVGELGDKVSDALTAAVLAVMGGDTGTATGGALFGVDWHNSVVATTVNYGLDLEGAAHDGYVSPRFARAAIRLGGRYSNAGVVETVNDVLIIFGTAAPTDGTSGTGAGQADAGSLFIRQSGANSKIYINGNTKASPTWKLVTSAA